MSSQAAIIACGKKVAGLAYATDLPYAINCDTVSSRAIGAVKMGGKGDGGGNRQGAAPGSPVIRQVESRVGLRCYQPNWTLCP
jgi:hypothetical protein